MLGQIFSSCLETHQSHSGFRGLRYLVDLDRATSSLSTGEGSAIWALKRVQNHFKASCTYLFWTCLIATDVPNIRGSHINTSWKHANMHLMQSLQLMELQPRSSQLTRMSCIAPLRPQQRVDASLLLLHGHRTCSKVTQVHAKLPGLTICGWWAAVIATQVSTIPDASLKRMARLWHNLLRGNLELWEQCRLYRLPDKLTWSTWITWTACPNCPARP